MRWVWRSAAPRRHHPGAARREWEAPLRRDRWWGPGVPTGGAHSGSARAGQGAARRSHELERPNPADGCVPGIVQSEACGRGRKKRLPRRSGRRNTAIQPSPRTSTGHDRGQLLTEVADFGTAVLCNDDVLGFQVLERDKGVDGMVGAGPGGEWEAHVES